MEKNKVELQTIEFKGGWVHIRTGIQNAESGQPITTVQLLPWTGWELSGSIHNKFTRLRGAKQDV